MRCGLSIEYRNFVDIDTEVSFSFSAFFDCFIKTFKSNLFLQIHATRRYHEIGGFCISDIAFNHGFRVI